MRTKHILTALAVPMVFAACTDEQFENNQSPALAKRPLVGQVTFVEDGANTRLADPTTGAMTFKDGDKFGMVLMDEPTDSSPNASIGTRGYSLVNKAYTNYPFTKSGDVWKSEAQLAEGNYFYYMPYTDNQTSSSKTAVKRDGGLQWVISNNQNAFTANAPTVLAPYNAVTENQLYVGYAAMDSDDPATTLDNKMIAAHATLGFKIVNNDAASITVKRVVLEYKTAGTKFKNKGFLDVEDGKTRAMTGAYTILVNEEEKVQDLAEGKTLADVFKLYNNDVKDNRNDFTKNPLMLAQDSYPFINGTENASSIALNFPGNGSVLANGQSVFAQMVVPAGMSTADLQARIYTDKGVTLLPIKTVNCTTAVAEDASEGFVAGDLEYTTVAANSTDYTATVALKKRNVAKPAEYTDVTYNSTFKASEVLPNGWNVATIGVTVAAIQVPQVMNIYTTADLDAFLGYCTLNPNVGEDGAALKAVIVANGVELSSAAYAVLKGNSKVKLTVETSDDYALVIPASLTDTDVLTRIIWAADSKVILNGNQAITKGSWDSGVGVSLGNLTVTNKAVLTINDFTGDRGAAVSRTLANLYNLGTVNVNSPLVVTADLVNGYTNKTIETAENNAAYNNVVVDAALVAKKDVTASNLANIGTITVDGDLKINATTKAENAKINKYNDATQVKKGYIVVNAGKTLKTQGEEWSNEGQITLNGILTADGKFTNVSGAVIDNNFGLENIAGQDLENKGTINVAADAHFTTLQSNTGKVNIMARDTEIHVATGEGTVAYTAKSSDLENGVFTLLPTDAFNTLNMNMGMTVNPSVVPATTRAVGDLVDGMADVLNELVLNVNATGTYKFHDKFYADKLTVANAVYMTVATDLTILSAVEIKNNATIQNNRDCTFTYSGNQAGFKDNGTFRNIGTLFCPGTLELSGVITGSGSIEYGYLPSAIEATGSFMIKKDYGVTKIADGAIATIDGKGVVTIATSDYANIKGKIKLVSANVKVVIGSVEKPLTNAASAQAAWETRKDKFVLDEGCAGVVELVYKASDNSVTHAYVNINGDDATAGNTEA